MATAPSPSRGTGHDAVQCATPGAASPHRLCALHLLLLKRFPTAFNEDDVRFLDEPSEPSVHSVISVVNLPLNSQPTTLNSHVATSAHLIFPQKNACKILCKRVSYGHSFLKAVEVFEA